MWRRLCLFSILSIFFVSPAGCRWAPRSSDHYVDRHGEVSYSYAPDWASKKIKEAAAEELQQSQRHNETAPQPPALQPGHAAPNTAMSYEEAASGLGNMR